MYMYKEYSVLVSLHLGENLETCILYMVWSKMELESGTVSMFELDGKKMCNRGEVDRGGIHSSFWGSRSPLV